MQDAGEGEGSGTGSWESSPGTRWWQIARSCTPTCMPQIQIARPREGGLESGGGGGFVYIGTLEPLAGKVSGMGSRVS